MAEGNSAELLLIGSEGMTGGTQLLGPANIQASCFVQLAATGHRMPFPELEHLFHVSEEIRTRLLEFLQHGALTVSQIAGCNRLHQAENRLARLLLMARDRTQSEILEFTQEFLAEMLGLQRTTITSIAGTFHAMELLRYSRGKITILDGTGMEALSCSCYAVTRRLLHNPYVIPFQTRTATFCSHPSLRG